MCIRLVKVTTYLSQIIENEKKSRVHWYQIMNLNYIENVVYTISQNSPKKSHSLEKSIVDKLE